MNRLIKNINKILYIGNHTNVNFKKHVLTSLNDYNGTEWKKYKLEPSVNNYEKNIIFRNKNYSLELLSWGGGSYMPIYDTVFIKKLQGNLDIYNSNTYNNQLGSVFYINDISGNIQVFNDKPSYSLHLYFPGFYETKFYWGDY